MSLSHILCGIFGFLVGSAGVAEGSRKRNPAVFGVGLLFLLAGAAAVFMAWVDRAVEEEEAEADEEADEDAEEVQAAEEVAEAVEKAAEKAEKAAKKVAEAAEKAVETIKQAAESVVADADAAQQEAAE